MRLLSVDHRLGQHLADQGELQASSADVQGSPDPGPLRDQLAEILLRVMAEGPGGMHHDVFLRPGRKLGVGIFRRGTRTYFTVDFTP